MKSPRPGLRGKFLSALIVASVLPLVAGLLILQTAGFRHLMEERGRVLEAEARALSRSLDQALLGETGKLRAWVWAGRLVPRLAFKESSWGEEHPEEVREHLKKREAMWQALDVGHPLYTEILESPTSLSLRAFMETHPTVAEIILTDRFGRLIAATQKTSDFDQSDEEWWQVGTKLNSGDAWADSLHFDASAGVYSLDVVFPLKGRTGEVSGVIKMVVEVSPLVEGLKWSGEAELIQLVMTNGMAIDRTESEASDSVAKLELSPDSVLKMRVGRNGWMTVDDNNGDQWMTGFAAIQSSIEDRQLDEPGGYVLFASPRAAIVAPVRSQLGSVAMAAGLVVLAFMIVGYALIHRGILKPLEILRVGARSVADSARLHMDRSGGDQGAAESRARAESELLKIESIRTGDQIEGLSEDFAVMTSRVLRYQRELEAEVKTKTAVIQDDLEMAREFQHALLPADYPQAPAGASHPLRLGFAHYYEPASTVGGDFFDLIELDDGKVGVLIADVMGHGARSALVTAILRSLVRNHAHELSSPGEFLGILNRQLHEVISRSGQTIFVSAFLMLLDPAGQGMSWAVAGHPAPLRARRGSGRLPEPLWSEAPKQPALGLIGEVDYRSHDEALLAGEVLLLYTDGLLEAESPAGEMYGMERLGKAFDESLYGPLAAMPAQIVCQASAFRNSEPYEDDVCVVVVECSVNRANSPTS